ncbi:MAG: hypothetical protein Q9191_006999, partial [Dirinaria sp. TL-2023a]
MQGLLTPVASKSLRQSEQSEELGSSRINPDLGRLTDIRFPEDALRLLQSQPTLELLLKALDWLASSNDTATDFSIKISNPKAAQIIFVLIHDIIPHYWSIIEHSKDRSHVKVKLNLVKCLRNVAGIAAIARRLQLLLKELPHQAKAGKSGHTEQITNLLHLLDCVLRGDGFFLNIWYDLVQSSADRSKKILLWKELVSLLASGKILSLCGEADHVCNEASPSIEQNIWLADGRDYAIWLGRNCASMIASLAEEVDEAAEYLAQIFSRALKIGYANQFIEHALSSLLEGNPSRLSSFNQILGRLTVNEQYTMLFSLMRVLSKRLQPFDAEVLDAEEKTLLKKVAAGAAALLLNLIQAQSQLKRLLIDWLNVSVQVLLLTAGYLHRSDPEYVLSLSKSSIYINAISNRLSASSERASLLGMFVGTAVSELVNPKGKRLNFSAKEIDSADGQWYRSLTGVQDEVGVIEDLKPTIADSKKKTASNPRAEHRHHKRDKLSSEEKPPSKIIAIEEVENKSDSEDDDLVAYEKPDSDVSDEDQDATLVQRNKPTAPVYIRELIAGLRDTDNFDRHKLALSNASSLIRRKASFGSEVTEHIEELATQLVGLGDKYNMEDFQKMRLQGMIAVLIAQPLKMGQWFSRTFFYGDYSMSQRASVLTTLGLGARELAGLEKEDAAMTGADAVTKSAFPSKLLPDKLHQVYAIEAKPVDAISKKMETTMMKPMAIEAADQISGPNALKVRTFSSRMEVEKKRAKPMANELAKTVADGFFFPLTGLWRVQLQAYGNDNVHTSPFLLTHYLKTLSLILHAAGTSPLSLPQMTTEFWDLLLSLRARAAGAPPVLEALLFAFLTLLDLNAEQQHRQRRLAEDHAKELLETREWVQVVFENVGAGSEEGDR